MSKTDNPYLIISDIDGTLVNKEGELVPSTVNTIQGLIKSGYLFATASARTRSYTIEKYPILLDLCCANAYANGAFTETAKGEILIDSPIEDRDISILVDHFEKAGVSFCCISKDHVVAKTFHPDFGEGFRRWFGDYAEMSFTSIEYKAYHIAAYAENILPVAELIAEDRLGIEVTPVISFDMAEKRIEALYMQKKGINKGAAMRTIAEYYGIEMSSTLAFGDGIWNDGPMISAAGCGVAMKNAHEEIKAIAERVTEKNNNEDGVGDFLRKFFV